MRVASLTIPLRPVLVDGKKRSAAVLFLICSQLGTRPVMRQLTKLGGNIVLCATERKKGALRFGLTAPVVAGARFERATFGL